MHVFALIVVVLMVSIIPRLNRMAYSATAASATPTKMVILTFGDTLKGQITTAKPILYKYGFKTTFLLPVSGWEH
jgi:peptidoglycan/xylan/chitin deacetylase (PgdA/CDA1 family)